MPNNNKKNYITQLTCIQLLKHSIRDSLEWSLLKHSIRDSLDRSIVKLTSFGPGM